MTQSVDAKTSNEAITNKNHQLPSHAPSSNGYIQHSTIKCYSSQFLPDINLVNPGYFSYRLRPIIVHGGGRVTKEMVQISARKQKQRKGKRSPAAIISGLRTESPRKRRNRRENTTQLVSEGTHATKKKGVIRKLNPENQHPSLTRDKK